MTATTSVAKPVLVVVDEDPDVLGTTEQALGDRYGRDYCVEGFHSATVALERLEQLGSDAAAGRARAVLPVAHRNDGRRAVESGSPAPPARQASAPHRLARTR